jgi:hypothetical protein
MTHPKENRMTTAITFREAQADMRDAYADGLAGVLVSATVWAAASQAAWGGFERGLWTLFVGGMFIHPLSVLLCKGLGRRGMHRRDNPLGRSALESTGWLMLCLPIAWAVAASRPDWFFPAMMLVIGGRYLGFATWYGRPQYWLGGGAIALGALASVALRLAPAVAAALCAGLEMLLALSLVVALRASRPGLSGS